ncbi:hypothetical protein GCM10025867_26410 [Frondihabitans sucicola]|uniref:Uncharacterized protein n=1 Tax=Frondihabitans sucicola TaxID=1268041 RepID=A0ABM8GPR1_9MICO|nr:hypothetical protein [Frondihabitans sucicola]BDZ50400.1 hypothetical protein GCM10025867_26410 [Frondihabitans sucicola]
MDADTLANIIQVVATLIALVGLAVSFVFSWQGQKLQKQQAIESAAEAAESNRAAQAAAQRAAASAALTIDDLARIAVALEKLAAERPAATSPGGRFEAKAAPAAPVAAVWRLTHGGGDDYRLANVGTAAAFDVWVGGAASSTVHTAWTRGRGSPPAAPSVSARPCARPRSTRRSR